MEAHPFPELLVLPFVYWNGHRIRYWCLKPAHIQQPQSYSLGFALGEHYALLFRRVLDEHPQWRHQNLLGLVVADMRLDKRQANQVKECGGSPEHFETHRSVTAGFLSKIGQLII